jgi:hypothetical protein
VLSGYKDFQTTLKQAVNGAVSSVEDSYQDGEWAFNGTVDYELDGQNSFEFESFHLIAEVGADTVYDYDLIRETGGAIAQEPLDETLPGEEPAPDSNSDGPADGTTDDQTDGATGAAENQTDEAVGTAQNLTAAVMENAENLIDEISSAAESQGDGSADTTENLTIGIMDIPSVGAPSDTADDAQDAAGSDAAAEPVSGMSGTQTMEFTCRAAETDTVKIYLTAVTKEGITLKLTLFEGNLRSNTELRMSELMTYTPVLDYYDKNNIKY